MRLPIAAIGVLCACTACGFKGPLYLPQHNATRVTHPPAKTTAASPAASGHKSGQKKAGDERTTPP